MNRITLVLISLCSIAILGVGVFKFLETYTYSINHFPSGAVINEIDCSELTEDKAIEKLSKEWNDKSIIFTTNGEIIGSLSEFDFVYDIKDQVHERLDAGTVQALMQLVAKEKVPVNITMTIKEPTQNIIEQIDKLDFLDFTYDVPTANAYIDKSDTEFRIVKEVYGDNIDPKRFTELTMKNIAANKLEVEFKPEDYYEMPTIVSNSKELLLEQDYCNKFLKQQITYELHTGSVTLTPAEIESMLDKGEDGIPVVNKEKVEKFVHMFANTHDTIGRPRPFVATGGATISVRGGNYGYAINKRAEAEQLAADLETRSEITREPIYSRRAFVAGSNEIGSSYIEVSLGAQHLWLYKAGQVVMSTPIVTGNVAMGSGTPAGIFGISYLDRNATLRGTDFDGSRYETPVSYWMPFNGGIGFHDAVWRTTFGGGLYLSGGSHGCINMPYNAAATLFNSIRIGFPVVVHY